MRRRRGAALDVGGHPAPLRLLGAFDPLLLAYADRRLRLAPADARAVNAGGGLIRPVVVSDGWVVGTWKRGRDTVEVTPFGELDGSDRASVAREPPTSPAS
ncbi:MAG: DNA glycosylase AlkZ-like family protein [Acidimicrobiales bacterium]